MKWRAKTTVLYLTTAILGAQAHTALASLISDMHFPGLGPGYGLAVEYTGNALYMEKAPASHPVISENDRHMWEEMYWAKLRASRAHFGGGFPPGPGGTDPLGDGELPGTNSLLEHIDNSVALGPFDQPQHTLPHPGIKGDKKAKTKTKVKKQPKKKAKHKLKNNLKDNNEQGSDGPAPILGGPQSPPSGGTIPAGLVGASSPPGNGNGHEHEHEHEHEHGTPPGECHAQSEHANCPGPLPPPFEPFNLQLLSTVVPDQRVHEQESTAVPLPNTLALMLLGLLAANAGGRGRTRRRAILRRQ